MRPTTLLLSLAGLAATGQAAPLTMLDIAPKDAIVTAGTDSFSDLLEAFGRTTLKSWWDQPAVQEWVGQSTGDLLDELHEQFAELDIDPDDLSAPTGIAGITLWINPEPDEDGEPRPMEFLAVADFGDNADTMADMIGSVLDKAEDDGEIWVDDEAFAGGTIWTIEINEEAEDEEQDDDNGYDDEYGWEAEETPFLDEQEQFLARHGSHMVIGSDLRQVETTLQRLAGEDVDADSAGEAEPITAALSAAGWTGHAFAVANLGPMFEMLSGHDEESDAGLMGLPDTGTILDVLGLSDVQSAAVNIRFDADDGEIESGFSAIVPDKKGLLALISPPPADFTPPSYVSPDASAVSISQFDFPSLFPTLNEMVGKLPPEMANEMRPQIQMAQTFAAPILALLGPKVYTVSSIERPFSIESQRTLVAIECSDTRSFEQALQGILQLTGMPLEAKPFQDGQIYELPDITGMMLGGAGSGSEPGFGVGVGSGAVLLGDLESVREAMRLAGQGDAASLASNDRFSNALGALKNQSGLFFSYSDNKQALEHLSWMIENSDEIAEAQLEATLDAMGLPPEQREQYREMMEEYGSDQGPEADMFKVPMLGWLAERIGDSVVEIRATDEGFVGRTLLLRGD